MRFKILSLFVAVQVLSFGLWSTISHAELSKTAPASVMQVHPAYAQAAPAVSKETSDEEESVLSMHFSSRNMTNSASYLNAIKINQIQTALKKLPQSQTNSVKNIVLDYDSQAHRGLGGNSVIILRAVNMSAQEMVGVLIHELGHNVDYGTLTASVQKQESNFKDGQLPVYESDPSLDFYRISWISNTEQKEGATALDFVSGYAMSDPFEDFAETYCFYVLHNKDFRVLATTSNSLYAKYRFMKYQVFGGKEFDTGDGQIQKDQRPWDVTVLPYDLNRFMS